MKKLKSVRLPILLLAGLCSLSTLRAQQIGNHSFEDWSQVIFFEEPEPYMTSNMQAYFTTASPNVLKTTDSYQGSFAARMETIPGDGENLPGVLILGDAGPMGLSGGVPYTGYPDSISAWVKYAPMPGDSAVMAVYFIESGGFIGGSHLVISGNYGSYTRVSAPVDWYIPEIFPDSLLMIVFSSNPDGSAQPGSILYLDEIVMTGTSEQLPNNGLEDWTPVSLEEPDEWFTSNIMTMFGSGPGIAKDTAHVDGTYSARITNMATMDGDILSFITNGHVGESGPSGGSPVFQNPVKITFFYKYEPMETDTALALGMLTRYDALSGSTVICDSVMVKLPAAEAWTYFELSFTYSGSPSADTLLFAAASGLIDDEINPPQAGSTLWIDKVEVAYPVSNTGIQAEKNFSVFPNPAGEEIFVTGPVETIRLLEILSPDGRIVSSRCFTFPTARIRLDLGALQAGLYLYRIHTGAKIQGGKIVKH